MLKRITAYHPQMDWQTKLLIVVLRPTCVALLVSRELGGLNDYLGQSTSTLLPFIHRLPPPHFVSYMVEILHGCFIMEASSGTPVLEGRD